MKKRLQSVFNLFCETHNVTQGLLRHDITKQISDEWYYPVNLDDQFVKSIQKHNLIKSGKVYKRNNEYVLKVLADQTVSLLKFSHQPDIVKIESHFNSLFNSIEWMPKNTKAYNQLQKYFEMSQDLIVSWNNNLSFESGNNEFLKQSEFSIDECKKMKLNDFIYPEDLTIAKKYFEKLNNKNNSISFQCRVVAKSKKILFLSWQIILNEDGTYFSVAHNLTKQKEIELHLEFAKNKAEEARQTKTRFLANMSHEIRTPMNGIIGMSEVLLSSAINDEIKNKIQLIHDSGISLLEIINDVLDFSKLEAGKNELELRPFKVEQLILDSFNLLKTKADQKNISFELSVNKNVPKYILGDSFKLKQIILNLLGNAIKFTDNGYIKISAEVLRSNQEDKKHLQFKVMDSGVGMADEIKYKLFKSFSQVDASTTRKYGGTGLGLAICKGLVELMGGKIWVESQVGKGSTFYFTIYASEAFDMFEDKKSEINKIQIDSQVANQYPLNIMVAEDNLVNQIVVREILKKFGYQIQICSNGEQAYDLSVNNNFDLILMDCHMPILDGFQATQKIIKHFKSSSILNRPYISALTASTMPEEIDQCYAVGMDDFLGKPIQAEALFKIIERAFAVKQNNNLNNEAQKKEIENLSLQIIDLKKQDQMLSMTVFDQNVLLKNCDQSEGLAITIIKQFFTQLPLMLSNIQVNSDRLDIEKIRRTLHTLKSNFRTLGGLRAAAVAEYLEGKVKIEFELGSEDVNTITYESKLLLSELEKFQEQTLKSAS